MRCWLVRRRLSRYQDGDLPAKNAAMIEQHLGRCRGCARELAQLRTTVAAMECLDEVNTGSDFAADVLAAIQSRRSVEQTAPPVLWPVGATLGIAGCVLSAAIVAVALSVDLGVLREWAVALGKTAGVAAEVAEPALVKLLLISDVLVRALSKPALVLLGADLGLLMVTLLVGPRLLARRQSARRGCIIAL